MAYRRTKGKAKGKGKKRAFKRKLAVVPRTRVKIGQGFPKQLTTMLKYSDTFNMTSTSGATATYYLSCNGIFDPNITGTGHQPLYYDQLMAIYDQWVVIGSKITYRIVPYTVQNVPWRFATFINDDSSLTPSNVDIVAEQMGGKMRLIGPNNTDCHNLRMSWSQRKNWGTGAFSNVNLSGAITNNPTTQQYFLLAINGMDSNSVTIGVDVMVEYIVVFRTLKDIAQS